MNPRPLLLATAAVHLSVCAETTLPVPGIPQSCYIQLKTHNYDIKTLNEVHAAGFRGVRRGFYWNAVETEKGTYDFSKYDEQMNHSRSLGLSTIGVLFNSHKDYEDDGLGGIQTEAGRQGFAAFAAALADHYRDYDITWEIWNEPNVRTFWRKDGKHNSPEFAKEYTDLVKAVVPAMLAANPDTVVVAGSLSNYWEPSYEWTESCFREGILETGIAAWSVHPYGVKTPEEFSIGHNRMLKLLKQYKHPDLPMVNTERGFAVKETLEGWSGGSKARALEYQAWHFVRQQMMDLLYGVRLTTWYEWESEEFGLVDKSGAHRPAYGAAVAMMKELDGYSLKGRLPTDLDLDYVLDFTNASTGGRILVAWTSPPAGMSPDETSDHDLTLAVTGGATSPVKDADGTVYDLSGNALVLKLTGKPIYVHVPADLALDAGVAGPGARKVAAAPPPPEEGEEINLYLFEPDCTWKFLKNTGDGNFALEKDGHGVSMGVLTYDFSKTKHSSPYVLAGADVDIPEGTLEFRIQARSTVPQPLTFRVSDATGQTHQYKKRIRGTGGWETIVIPLTKRLEHWGGAKDGVVHFPIKSVYLSVPRPNAEHLTGTVEYGQAKAIMAKGSKAPTPGTR